MHFSDGLYNVCLFEIKYYYLFFLKSIYKIIYNINNNFLFRSIHSKTLLAFKKLFISLNTDYNL